MRQNGPCASVKVFFLIGILSVCLSILPGVGTAEAQAADGTAPEVSSGAVSQTGASAAGESQALSEWSFSVSGEAQETVEGLWNVSWERFFIPNTHNFYDYLTSYEPGKYQQHLPTVEEARRVFPNEYGYGTGMEDGMIFSGPWMTAVICRALCEAEKAGSAEEKAKVQAEMKRLAHEIFLGIELCATVHSDPGFLARAVLPADGKSVYPNSSRDQYTHAVQALWFYCRSSLCEGDEAEKEAIRKVLSLIADRMIRNVIPENDYDSLRLDGSRDPRTISRMWKVRGHEAARLPMIYAAAWDTCRESGSEELRKKSETYFAEYRKYVKPAVEQSLALDEATLRSWVPTYALLQMQCSLELLYLLEEDPEVKADLVKAMEKCFDWAQARLENAENYSKNLDMTFLFKDWRVEGGGIPWATGIRSIWYSPRESGEAFLTQLMCPTREIPEKNVKLLENAILRLQPDRVATSGIFYLVSAYWNAQRRALNVGIQAEKASME